MILNKIKIQEINLKRNKMFLKIVMKENKDDKQSNMLCLVLRRQKYHVLLKDALFHLQVAKYSKYCLLISNIMHWNNNR